MKNRKMVALVAGALLLLLAVPAHAAHTYVGSATAIGLELTLLDQGLTVGFSESAVQSAPSDEACGADRGNACASSAGALIIGNTAEAFAPGNEGPDTVEASAIPEQLSPLLRGTIGTAEAEVEVDGTDLAATSRASGIDLALTATPTLAESLPVRDAIDQLSETLLGPIDDGDPTALAERLRATIDQLGENVLDAPLLTLTGGPSSTATTDVGGVTTATATAQGGVLVIAPTPANVLPLAPEGLIIVEVGQATATATTDQTTASSAFTPALVTLRVYDPVTMDYDEVQLAPGQSRCGAEGTPLEVCISVGGGMETVEGAGAAASAAGVSIRALAGPLPTLQLSLAEATAAVASAPPAAPAPPAPTPSRNLPRTGGGPALPALALLSLGSIGWYSLRRRD